MHYAPNSQKGCKKFLLIFYKKGGQIAKYSFSDIAQIMKSGDFNPCW